MRYLNFVRWLAVAALIATLVAPILLAAILHIKYVAVDGESMEPTFKLGDVVLVRAPLAGDLKPGAVVTVKNENGQLYTHRIVRVTDGELSLKGDGNRAPDPRPISAHHVVGVVDGHLGQPFADALVVVLSLPGRISIAMLVIGLIYIPMSVRRRLSPTNKAPGSRPMSNFEEQLINE